MEYANALALLEKDVVAWFKTQSIRIALEDRPFTEAENEKRFVKHAVLFGSGDPISLGAKCFRFVGIQYLSIMYRPGEGLNSIYRLVDGVVQRYSPPFALAPIIFETSSAIKRPTREKGLAEMQVVCPFYFDVTRS